MKQRVIGIVLTILALLCGAAFGLIGVAVLVLGFFIYAKLTQNRKPIKRKGAK